VPKLHIASIGIEKVIPRLEHLAVFVRLLSRSALGSPITQYTSHFRGPREGGEMHFVLVDNGRSERLGMTEFWTSLKCIRCGACMNTLPGLSAQRGLKLRRHLFRSHRPHHRSDVQRAQIQQSALRLHA
jgi:L-lactate dehydrogenase complex protein LldF